MMIYVKRLFDHMRWADARVLRLARGMDLDPEVSDRVLRLLAHVIAAERVWLSRVTGEADRDLPIWPDWSIAEAAEAAEGVDAAYARLLEGLTDEDLARIVEYSNSRGVPFRTRLGDILVHVATHGSYHRGQIAASVRSGGGEPVNTDFITFVREIDG